MKVLNNLSICIHIYCEQSTSETLFVKTTLFNDAACENRRSIYMKWQQVKIEWGVSWGEGKGEREEQIKGVREGASETA